MSLLEDMVVPANAADAIAATAHKVKVTFLISLLLLFGWLRPAFHQTQCAGALSGHISESIMGATLARKCAISSGYFTDIGCGHTGGRKLC
jgi:hypothetical protein